MSTKKETGASSRSRSKKQAEDMPDVRPVLAVTSDWHLRTTTPSARAEEDWLEVQTNYIYQIVQKCNKHKIDLAIAGDVFDDGWRPEKCPPSLINYAIDQLNLFQFTVYAVAGQHDLPNHRLDKVKETALWTLCEAAPNFKLIKEDEPEVLMASRSVLYGMSWGAKLPEPITHRVPQTGERLLNIAVIHANVWTSTEDKHQHAKDSEHARKWQKRLEGFDVAVFGDNHTPTSFSAGKPTIFNNGGHICRNSDEKGQWRGFGLVMSDGTVKRVKFDQSKDKWKDVEELVSNPAANEEDLKEAMVALKEASGEFYDFCKAVWMYVNKKEVRQSVKDLISGFLAEGKG